MTIQENTLKTDPMTIPTQPLESSSSIIKSSTIWLGRKIFSLVLTGFFYVLDIVATSILLVTLLGISAESLLTGKQFSDTHSFRKFIGSTSSPEERSYSRGLWSGLQQGLLNRKDPKETIFGITVNYFIAPFFINHDSNQNLRLAHEFLGKEKDVGTRQSLKIAEGAMG